MTLWGPQECINIYSNLFNLEPKFKIQLVFQVLHIFLYLNDTFLFDKVLFHQEELRHADALS